MIKISELPKTIPVFPLSNFIFFPNTNVPLNIFEPRYVKMINDCMKGNRMLGMIQPKKTGELTRPDLFDIGCMGKITSFHETEDGRYLVVLNGICRFKLLNEIETKNIYRQYEVDFSSFKNDLFQEKEEFTFSDLDLIFKNLKSLFKKDGYLLNWKDLEKQSLSQTINSLSMASPFSLEEKQILLETKNLLARKEKLEQILQTYILDNFSNNTLQ